MKSIASVLAIALMTTAVPALAQSNPSAKSPKVAVPSGQNSGAGVHGYPGNKNGPATGPGTVGSTNQDNSAVKQQDAAKIKGLPGNKSGPAAKPK